MKTYLTILTIFLSASIYAQNKNLVEKTFNQIKRTSKVDKTDSTCYNLMQKMYDEVLQAENSTLTESTLNEVINYQESRKSKNTYLFSAFMFYQEVIAKSAKEKVIQRELQRDIVNYLETESLELYNKIPIIVYVYKVETLNFFDDKSEMKKYIDEGLKNYPNSIPLKYYSYKYLNEQTYKEELLKINKKHWLVEMEE